ncbi:MAG: hypothetical protein RIC56_00875 [Pseudomonadales bacterium]
MCVAGDEESGGTTTATDDGSGDIPEILVTAPRLGLDQAVIDSIDWSEVWPAIVIGAATGGYKGGIGGALVTGAAAGATTIESQEGIDLIDLFEIRNDMIVVPGVPAPYIPLY